MKKRYFSFNWPLIANTQVTEFLATGINNNKIAGTYIFYGPDNLGKTTTAKYFAQCLLCDNYKKKEGLLPCGHCASCISFTNIQQKEKRENILDNIVHGDFHTLRLEKDKKNISIEQVRDFIRLLKMSSFLGLYKIGIIKHAEALSESAANALLKTLEEPNKNTIIILITKDKESLLPTIVSRSQLLKFMPVKTDLLYEYLIDKHGASRATAKNFSRLSLGRPALAVKFLQDKEFYQKYVSRVNVFLNFFNQDLNDRLAAIEKDLDLPNSGPEAVKIARRILEIWQGVVRDGFLLAYLQKNNLQHEFVREEIERFLRQQSLPHLWEISQNIQKGFEYLRANISAKNVLENIAINI